MEYTQYRLAKRDGEIIMQARSVRTKTNNKWYKPWEYTIEREYGEWKDIPFVEVSSNV